MNKNPKTNMKKTITILSLLTSLSFSLALTNSTNFHSIGTTNVSAGDYGVKFVANNTTSITSVTTANNTQATAVKILNSSYATIGTATITDHVATFSTPIEITSGSTYYALINNGSSPFLTDYGNTFGDLPHNNTDINFPSDAGAVFKTPYNVNVTSLTTGGGNNLGITNIITDSSVVVTPPNTPTSDPKVLFFGDSLTEGIAVTNPYPSLINVPSNFTKLNLGVSSKTTANILAESDSVNATQLGSNKADDIIVVWAGSADLYISVGTSDAITTFNNLKAFCLKEKALGSKVVVLTMLPRPNNTVVFSKNEYLAYNNLIRTHWTEFADGLADVQSDPIIGTDDSNYNTTYYADTVHLTQAGYVIVANYVQNTLHGIDPTFPAGTPSTPPVLTKAQRLLNAGFTQAQVDLLLEIFNSN